MADTQKIKWLIFGEKRSYRDKKLCDDNSNRIESNRIEIIKIVLCFFFKYENRVDRLVTQILS